MKKNFLVFFACILVQNVFSQKNFLPGFMVTMQGDTVMGKIDYRNWENNPRVVKFIDGSGAEHELVINDTREFEISGFDNYKRMVVSKDMAPVRLDQLKNAGFENYVVDTVFLRTVVHGRKLTLYELQDEKKHFYLQRSGEAPVELRYRVYLSGNSNQLVTTEKGWQNQLKSQMSFADKALIKKIERSSYSLSDLRKIVLELDTSAVVPDAKNDPMTNRKKIDFFAGVGIDNNNLDLGHDTYKSLNNLNRMNSPWSMRLTAGMDIFALRSFQKLFLRAGISYTSYTYKGEKETQIDYSPQREKRTYELTLRSITPGVSVNFSLYKKNDFAFFIGTGMGIHIASYPRNTYTTENLTTGTVTREDDYMKFEKSWLGLTVNAGLQWKQFELYADYMYKGGFSSYVFLGYSYKPAGFSLLYHFNR